MPMDEMTTLYIDKESHKFSVAHFTIFSATERERLHGHNYSVSTKIVAPMGANGFSPRPWRPADGEPDRRD